MYKKTITYTDFHGSQRSEDHYFNYTEAEIVEMENSSDKGLKWVLEKIIREHNKKKLIRYFKKIILGSYGVPSEDGTVFTKSEALRTMFSNSLAYSALFMELATNDVAASDFFKGIMPKRKTQPQETVAPIPTPIQAYQANQPVMTLPPNGYHPQ